jgi:hypothetical protein
MRCDTAASSFVAKVRGEVLAHFMRNWLFGLPGRILSVKENDEHALDFALHLLAFFCLGEFGRCV